MATCFRLHLVLFCHRRACCHADHPSLDSIRAWLITHFILCPLLFFAARPLHNPLCVAVMRTLQEVMHRGGLAVVRHALTKERLLRILAVLPERVPAAGGRQTMWVCLSRVPLRAWWAKVKMKPV